MQSKGGMLYVNASRSVTIRDATLKDINSVLDKGMLLLGIKGDKVPINWEKQIMIDELKKQYAKMKLGELDLAFTLAARGELDFANDTYQNFTVLYLNRMLTAYLRWAQPYAYAPDEVKDAIPYRAVSDQEKIDTDFRCYAKFRDWENFVFGIQTYYILKNQQVVGDISSEVTKQVKGMMYETAMQMSNTGDKKNYRSKLTDDEYLNNQCRRWMVAQYFDQFLTPKTNKLPLTVKEHEDAMIQAATVHFLMYQNFETILCGSDVFGIMHRRGDLPIERKLIYDMTEGMMRTKLKTLQGQHKDQHKKNMADEAWQEHKCRLMSLANHFMNQVA